MSDSCKLHTDIQMWFALQGSVNLEYSSSSKLMSDFVLSEVHVWDFFLFQAWLISSSTPPSSRMLQGCNPSLLMLQGCNPSLPTLQGWTPSLPTLLCLCSSSPHRWWRWRPHTALGGGARTCATAAATWAPVSPRMQMMLPSRFGALLPWHPADLDLDCSKNTPVHPVQSPDVLLGHNAKPVRSSNIHHLTSRVYTPFFPSSSTPLLIYKKQLSALYGIITLTRFYEAIMMLLHLKSAARGCFSG